MDRRLRFLVAGLLVTLVGGAAFLLSPEWMLKRLGWLAANPLRLGLALLVLALLRPVVAWPATLVAVLAGYGWGLVAFPAAVALMVVTCTPPYLFARHSTDGGRFSEAGERAVGVAGDFRSVVAGRLFPAPSDIVSMGAGLADVPPRTYLGATAIGQIPWAFFGVAAGDSVHRVASEGITAVVSPSLVVALVAVGGLMLAGPTYKYATGQQDADVKEILAK